MTNWLFCFLILLTGVSYTQTEKPVYINEEFPKIYWGDLHVHSNLSNDSRADVDSVYLFAKNISKLDFICVSDHDSLSNELKWQKAQEKVNQYYNPGNFVTLLGYEYTAEAPEGGHKIVYYPHGNAPRFSRLLNRLDSLYSKIKKHQGIIHIAHPDQQPLIADPEKSDPEVVRNIEIQGYGRYRYEFFGNPGAPPFQEPDRSVQDWLKRKRIVGFLGVSDSHDGRPGSLGLTGVYANELTRESIFEAIMKRRVFAVSRFKMKAYWECNNTYFMGDSVLISSNVHRNFLIKYDGGQSRIMKIEIIKNNKIYHTFDPNKIIGEYGYRDIDTSEFSFYYVKLYQSNGNVVWLSPIYFFRDDEQFFVPDINENLNNKKTDINFTINVFPNPFNSISNIQIDTEKEAVIEINIYDVFGGLVRTVVKQSINVGKFSYPVQMENLPSGIYYLHAQINGKRITKKLSYIK